MKAWQRRAKTLNKRLIRDNLIHKSIDKKRMKNMTKPRKIIYEVWSIYLVRILGWNDFHRILIEISLTMILYLFYI